MAALAGERQQITELFSPLCPGFFTFKILHDTICMMPFPQKVSHELHGMISMSEESLVTGAKVISVLFAMLCYRKAVLGAFAVADKQIVALMARAGQVVAPILTELVLLFRA